MNAWGVSVSYLKTDAGTKVLLPAVSFDRVVHISVSVDEAFANGTGAQPTVKIGQTGTLEKFATAAGFTNAAAKLGFAPYHGVLTKGMDLLATLTAATGTATGGVTISIMATGSDPGS